MDFNTALQAIGSVGFPIVACCAMFYLYNKILGELTTTLSKIDTTLEILVKRLMDGEKNEHDR